MTQATSRMKERIALLLPGLYEGGAERTMLNLAKGMADRGYRVDLVLTKAEGPFLDAVPDSVRLIDLKAPRIFFSTPALVKYLRNERPNALLSVLHTNIIAAWAKRIAGVPVRVLVCEQNNLSSYAKGDPDIRLKTLPILARWFYPWTDGVVGVSDGVANDLKDLLKNTSTRVQVIYNPIVTAELFEKARTSFDHPWFKPGQPPVLLATGRLTTQKAYDVLLPAFAQVRKKLQVHLLILGEGEDRAKLEALVKEYGLENDISLFGFVPNPYPYMKNAAAFVLSSRWEGLPTVLVEAMSLGTPIVSTNCPSGPSEILMDGKYGLLVPVEDRDALAQAIEKVLTSNELHPSKESWQLFTLDCVVEQYLKALLGH